MSKKFQFKAVYKGLVKDASIVEVFEAENIKIAETRALERMQESGQTGSYSLYVMLGGTWIMDTMVGGIWIPTRQVLAAAGWEVKE